MNNPDSAVETTMFEAPGVKITSHRAVIDEVTYAMSNITSVSMKEKQNNSGCMAVVMILGGAYLIYAGFNSRPDEQFFIALGVLLIIIGLVVVRFTKPTFELILGSASGEKAALISQDKDHLTNIVNAMNEAIVKRG